MALPRGSSFNFQQIWRLTKDAWHTENVWDKIRIWFMPTGWRPADVIEKYPIEMIKDVYQFDKFTTQANRVLKLWSSYQLVITVALSLFMFYNYEAIGFNNLLFYGLMIFIGIYGYTTLMDRRRYAVIIEIIRSLIGLAVINYTGDWFGLNDFLMFGSQIVALYFISTIIGALYFTFIEKDFGTTKQEQI